MSKCQMRKFMPGGRCGGGGGDTSNRDTQSSLSSAYSNLLQQRALQEKGVFQQTPIAQNQNQKTDSLQLVKKVEEKLSNSSQRLQDIDFILNGDM